MPIPSQTIDRCPECGRGVADRSVPKPERPLQWRVMVPWIVALSLLTCLAILISRTGENFRYGYGSTSTYMVSPPFTLKDVKQIAAGERSSAGTSLAQALLDVHSFGQQFGDVY